MSYFQVLLNLNFQSFECIVYHSITQSNLLFQNLKSHSSMFPSSNSCNNNPFQYSYGKSFPDNENPNFPRQEEDQLPSSSFLSHFPSPNNELLSNLFYSCQSEARQVNEEMTTNFGVEHENSSKFRSNPRKRTTGKKDRHSKIYTAQGPRDRRMRLSVQIARKFFDLQDMLGFDKASKTVEWLFAKSKAAIKEIMGSSSSNFQQVKHTCNIEGEESISNEIKGTSYNGDHNEVLVGKDGTLVGFFRAKNDRKVAKEGRDKARARARERTREKMMMRISLEKSKQNPNLMISPFENGEELSGGSHSQQDMMNSPLEAANHEVEELPANYTRLIEHQIATVGIIDEFFASRSSSSSIHNQTYNICVPSDEIYSSNKDFPVFQGDWIINNSTRSSMHYSNYCCTMTDVHPSTSTGDVHQQNPNLSFFTSSSNISLLPGFFGN